jgi:hypothetical protein
MAREAYRKILELVLQAAQIAREVGIPNLLQPGLVKEMIIADILGHQLITTKHAADACSPDDSNELYEYLSCKEGGTGQFDRMFKEPREKREESLDRIRRNSKVYYAVFYKANQTKAKIIYELDPAIVVKETERQLDRSKNAISHVGFPEAWVAANGTVVFRDQ